MAEDQLPLIGSDDVTVAQAEAAKLTDAQAQQAIKWVVGQLRIAKARLSVTLDRLEGTSALGEELVTVGSCVGDDLLDDVIKTLNSLAHRTESEAQKRRDELFDVLDQLIIGGDD